MISDWNLHGEDGGPYLLAKFPHSDLIKFMISWGVIVFKGSLFRPLIKV